MILLVIFISKLFSGTELLYYPLSSRKPKQQNEFLLLQIILGNVFQKWILVEVRICFEALLHLKEVTALENT